MKIALASTLMLVAPALAWAEAPDACSVLTMDEINSVAGGTVVKVLPVRSGNPSECNFMDAHRAAVLAIKIREVQYAAADELAQERENDQKVYHQHAKDVKAVGEHAYWSPASHTLGFHKGKTLVFVTFQRQKNANEVDSAQLGRMIEQRLK
ncbi:MAG TPA: hypothetical protein VLT60_09595 [Usitatibacter sp.]|nr:hypothetical protein [Usitatibacter sp.]